MGTALTADAGAATAAESQTPDPASGSATPDVLLKPDEIQWTGPTETPERDTVEIPDEATDPDAKPSEATAEAETPAEVFTIEVPLPSTDGKDRGSVALDLPSQEIADTLKHHAKLAAKVPALETRLEQSSADAETLAYIREHPEQGLGWLAQQFPKAAEQFLASAIESNPLAAAQTLQAMGFDVQMLKDEDTISAKSELAKLKQADRLRTGQQDFTRHQAASLFAQTASAVVGDLTTQLGIPDGPRFAMFTAAVQPELQKLYQQSPRAGQAQIIAALTPLVTEFQNLIAEQTKRSSVKATLAKEQPRDPAGLFKALADKNATFRKVAGGQTVVSPVSALKVRPNETMEEASARLRSKGARW